MSESSVTQPRTRPPYWRKASDSGGRSRDGAPPGNELAALRSGIGRQAGSVPAMWPFYVSLDDTGRLTARLQAEHEALCLYAVHQQGQIASMHRAGVGFGSAVAALRGSGQASEDAVDRRFVAAATATSREEAVVHIRGLVTQLKGLPQPLDYDRLWKDLVGWADAKSLATTRRAWGAQYFAGRRTAVDDPTTNETVTAEETR